MVQGHSMRRPNIDATVPFEILQWIGPTAYQLNLLDGARLHNVFHVSKLKVVVGSHVVESSLPPDFCDDTLEFRHWTCCIEIWHGDDRLGQLLVSWDGLLSDDPTWVDEIARMERIVKEANWHESIYWHSAAHDVPKSLHCLSLNLTEEYAINSVARSPLPLPQYVYRLTGPSFHHVVLLRDNLLATYASLHAWFALNTIDSAVVEVKGLHQYDWSHEVNVAVKEMLEILHQIWNHKYRSLKKEDFEYWKENDNKLDVPSPSSISLLNHLRIYLPELFPEPGRIVLLDDDVVQQNLASLWDLDLNQKVVDCCPGRKYKDYFNFTDPTISSSVDQNRCGWLNGVNVFDLGRWRQTNITLLQYIINGLS
ncbi:hypothetical protein OROGR_015095 [Orobanche gracilis]